MMKTRIISYRIFIKKTKNSYIKIQRYSKNNL